MNVTLVWNIVYASISITIGSSLCVGGILLVSALPLPWKIYTPIATFSRQIMDSGWTLATFLSLLFCVPLYLSLFDSHSVSVSCSLSFCLLVNISLFVSLSFHCFSLSHSLASPYQRRASIVHHQNQKAVSRHTGVVILPRNASIIICSLPSNVSLDQRWTSTAH